MAATAAAGDHPPLELGRLERVRRRGARRSSLLVFGVLLVVYAAGLGLHARPGSDLRPSEAHVLLTTESIVSGGDVELTDEYRRAAWRSFYPGTLRPTALAVNGRLIEPQGLVFPLLLAPAYALGGRIGAELLLAAIAAAGFAAAAALGRRLVPDPWATGAALAVGLSPPAVLAATTISPAATCACLVAGAAVLALRVRDEPRGGPAAGCAALLALVPWIGPAAILPAAVVAAALFRWLRRRRRAWTGIAAIEIVLLSVVVYVTVNGRLFGGLTPYAAATGRHPPTGIGSFADALARWPRLLGVWADPRYGVLVFAPFVGLAFVSLWRLWRSRRERLARAFPGETDVEVAAGFLAAICMAAVLTAVVLYPTLHGLSPGEALVVALPCAAALCAWSLRRWPRVGTALALVGVVLSVWLLAAPRIGARAAVSPPAGPVPWSVLGA